MDNESLKRGLAIALSGYAKRWMESGVYDRFINTEFGQQLKGLDPKAKYGIEGGLYILTAILEQKFGEDTPIKALIKELSMDAGPEIAKRMINGGESPAQAATPSPDTPVAKGNAPSALLALEQNQLSELLLWLSAIEAERRKRLIAGLGRLAVEDLIKFVAMPAADRERFAQHFLGIDDEAAFKRLMGSADDAKERVLNGLHDSILKMRLGHEYQAVVESQPEATQAQRNNALYATLREKNSQSRQARGERIEKQTASSNRAILILWVILGVALVAMIVLNR